MKLLMEIEQDSLNQMIAAGSAIAQEMQELLDAAEATGCSELFPESQAAVQAWNEAYLNMAENWFVGLKEEA